MSAYLQSPPPKFDFRNFIYRPPINTKGKETHIPPTAEDDVRKVAVIDRILARLESKRRS